MEAITAASIPRPVCVEFAALIVNWLEVWLENETESDSETLSIRLVP